jgi:hypothetical protein
MPRFLPRIAFLSRVVWCHLAIAANCEVLDGMIWKDAVSTTVIFSGYLIAIPFSSIVLLILPELIDQVPLRKPGKKIVLKYSACVS